MIKSLEQTRKELSVDYLVSMNQQKIVNSNQSIGTFALCGCTCFCAISESEILLSHYDPCSVNTQISSFKNWSQNKSFELHIFTPGEWVKDGSKWVMQPRRNFDIDNAVVKCYSESVSSDENLFSRSVAWNGQKIVSGLTTF
jgi:hypothetical protein